MKRFFHLLFFCPGFILAQPTVSLCLDNTGSALELKIIPDAAFSGFVANIQFTIQSDDPSVSYGLPSGILAYIPMAKAGGTMTFGGSAYQKFTGFGTLSLSMLGDSWAAGDVITLFSIIPSNLSANYSIAIDSWASDNNGEYYVELDAIDKTGSTSLCSSTLPVEGLNLNAAREADFGVALHWQTLRETQSQWFVVEKKRDQSPFEVIDSIRATGHSQDLREYRLLDMSPMGAQNQYRIKQIDRDGSFQYSNVVALDWQSELVGDLYPNPCGERVYLPIGLKESAEVEVLLFNQLGQEVEQIKRSAKPGSHYLQIPTINLSAGIYLVEVRINGIGKNAQKLLVR